jgi:hypothetical protein
VSDSEEGLEHWQQRMHEVSTRRCVCITRSLRWIGTELCNPPRYDGLTDISMFVKTFELQVPEQQRLLALDVVLKVTPARWWVAHREGMKDWLQCNRLMQIRFGTEGENIVQKYTGESDPTGHVEQCRDLWGSVPETEWTHIFIHTLDTIPEELVFGVGNAQGDNKMGRTDPEVQNHVYI